MMVAGRKYILLYPLSLLYGFITSTRNFLYNTGILKGKEYNLPVICVGNITVGGTGKTPHCEYLANFLKANFKVALLSRGYRRSGNSFLIAGQGSTSAEIGDEPLQIYLKNPDILVAVDGNRVRGIENILRIKPDTEVIILDDGFQHRRLIPGLSILLTDFSRLMIRDHLLPYGELRESISNMYRADIILVTKCPPDISPIQRRIVVKEMKKAPYQNLYFTTYTYGDICQVFGENTPGDRDKTDDINATATDVLLVTGIANPDQFAEYVKSRYRIACHLRFPDHHRYSEKEIAVIINALRSICSERKIIITTEKDAVRLKELINIVPEDECALFYYIPVKVHFLNDDSEEFNNLITDYVRKNKRNNRLS